MLENNSLTSFTNYAHHDSPPSFDCISVDIFEERNIYLNCLRIYYAYFKSVPNIKVASRVDVKKAIGWLETENKGSIVRKHYRQRFDPIKKTTTYANVIYILSNGVMIDLENDCAYIVFGFSLEQEAQLIFDKVKQFIRVKKKASEICLVVRGLSGLQTTALTIKKPNLKIDNNYNDDFPPVHKGLLTKLRKDYKSGLILLHGAPGTGKSTYIRYLIQRVKKPVIFLPPALASEMDSPGFMEFLIEHKNSIFVIEDSEQLLVSRGANRSSSISTLLNLTDGLLGECLGIQVIATFNTLLSDIDQALLRKGRLMGMYEFRPLSEEKANNLLKEMGVEHLMYAGEMSVADIYNYREEAFSFQKQKRPAIGFKTA